jgi:hypothetical protein
MRDECASAAQRPRRLGGGDELGSIVGPIAQTLVVGEDPSQLRIVTLALVDEHPDKLRLDKRVTPLPGRANPLT